MRGAVEAGVATDLPLAPRSMAALRVDAVYLARTLDCAAVVTGCGAGGAYPRGANAFGFCLVGGIRVGICGCCVLGLLALLEYWVA